MTVGVEIIVPYDEQDMRWAEDWRDRYYKVIEKADAAPALPFEYTDICDTEEDYRDACEKYMLDNCDMMIVVVAGEDEPIVAELARDRKIPIVYIDVLTLKVWQ